MELSEQANWIMTAVELNICMRILGRKDQVFFPVAKSVQPLERRMLNAFLHLEELGLLAPNGDGYHGTEKLQRIDPLAKPDRVAAVSVAGIPLLFLFFRGDSLTATERLAADGQTWRVSSPEASGGLRLLEHALFPTEVAEETPPLSSLEIQDGSEAVRKRIRFQYKEAEWSLTYVDTGEDVPYSQTLLWGLVTGEDSK